MRVLALLWLLGLGLLWAVPAHAFDPCSLTRNQIASTNPAQRVAAVACAEHELWFRAFIDRQGRLADYGVMESENRNLADGSTPAWRKVAAYWRESGLLPQMRGNSGASDCAVAERGSTLAPACRAFVVDQPWSAAFISWVLMKARLPGFRPSASHIDYVRQAYQQPLTQAYDFHDIALARPAAGDMLCYVRDSQSLGHAGVLATVGGRNGLNMHCEIVVGTYLGNDGTVYLIGGNVQQGVTMRMLPLNAQGQLSNLPLPGNPDPICSPDQPAGCNFNRQDWAVWLKLKPAAQLAALSPPVPMSGTAVAVAVAPRCCVQCVLGAGVPRCPPAEAPLP